MNPLMNKQHMQASISLAQEWKLSGMSYREFAKTKGISPESLKYHVHKVRRESPESLDEAALATVQFVPVPQKCMDTTNIGCPNAAISGQPVLTIQTATANLQICNQVNPYLLKTALEVILSC